MMKGANLNPRSISVPLKVQFSTTRNECCQFEPYKQLCTFKGAILHPMGKQVPIEPYIIQAVLYL